jgi:hypothetical protein
VQHRTRPYGREQGEEHTPVTIPPSNQLPPVGEGVPNSSSPARDLAAPVEPPAPGAALSLHDVLAGRHERKQCEACHEWMYREPNHKAGAWATKRYCDWRCQRAAFLKNNAEFFAKREAEKEERKAARKAWMSERRNCKVCGAEFGPRTYEKKLAWQRSNRVYCSRSCADVERPRFAAGNNHRGEAETICLPDWPSNAGRFEDVSAETLRREMPLSLGPRLVIPRRPIRSAA